MPRNSTLSDAAALWLKRAQVDGLEQSTLRQYEQHLRLHIEPLIGGEPLDQITPPKLESFKDRLLQSRSRALSRKVITSVKGILNEAVRLGLTSYNPALAVRVKNAHRRGTVPFSGPASVESMPSKDELRRLIQTSEKMFPLKGGLGPTSSGWCMGTWWHGFLLLAVFSGMRSSELRGLVWKNVDLNKGFVLVRQRADFTNQLGPPKSPAANRDIPMAPIVSGTLAKWQPLCPETDLGFVFPSRNRRVHTNSNIHKMFWGPLQMAADITKVQRKQDGSTVRRPRLNFHALRHAAATLFIEQGWPPKKVQAVMGHSSIQVTFDIYGKLWSDPEADLAAMARLEQRLLGPS
jgi:integrase